MSEYCPYAARPERCPVSPFIAKLAGEPCTTNEHGNEICGPIAALNMLNAYAEYMEVFDAEDPIVGNMEIITDKAQVVDEESWIGVTLPIRSVEQLSGGEVAVSSVDIELSLLAQGKFILARQYTMANQRTNQPFDVVFTPLPKDVVVTKCDAISSWDYYTAKVEPDVREALRASQEMGAN